MHKNQAFPPIPTLNKEQEVAVLSKEQEPLLIVAGAGTGKTRALTSRVLFFLSSGVSPYKICAITFTNKAAREMRERVLGKASKGSFSDEPFIGTFHSLGAKILREEAGAFRRTPGFTIFDEQDSFSLMKKTLKEADEKATSPALFRDLVSQKKGGGDPFGRKGRERLERVFSAYESALERNNAFDFDDLIEKSVSLLRSSPETRQKHAGRFSHILIDEYQDLNPSQYELVRLLADEGTSLTAVGDAEQTIYGWRGSDINIFLGFPKDWSGAKTVTLTENYRSTQRILEAAGAVIGENEYESAVPRAIRLSTKNEEGERVRLYAASDEEDEAIWVATQILGSEYRDAAILYRTNAQSRAIESALIAYNIPYRIYGGLKFYERREIKDILAGLRLALNPQDEVSRERLEKAFTKRRARLFFPLIEELKEKSPKDAVESFIRVTDYLSYVERGLTNPGERRENIEELIRFASEFSSLPDFLERAALTQSTDAPQGRAEGATERSRPPVQLMTIHMAKGLEFDEVFVAGVSEGFLPHARSLREPKTIQEERRLLYVAMTRARKRLSMSFYGIPSRFLAPLGTLEIDWVNGGGYEQYSEEERYITLD